MKLTNEDVQGILRLLDATKYDELHLETERFKLTLRRNRESGDWTQERQVLSAPKVMQSSAGVSGGAVNVAPVAATATSDARKSGWIEVRAHLPGTFYRAPKPGASLCTRDADTRRDSRSWPYSCIGGFPAVHGGGPGPRPTRAGASQSR